MGRLPIGTARGAALAVLALLMLIGAPSPAPAADGDLLIFAAASLKNALDDVDAQYAKATGHEVRVSFAGSSTLAKQIEAGAPADVFISADLDWMDYLDKQKLLRPGTRADILGNRLVLIAPKGQSKQVRIEKGFPLADLLKDGFLAMADTDAVPAGKYGKASLQALGVWNAVKSRIAQALNVRAALALVSRGETPYGIVYQTDAAADPNVEVVGVFPDDTHPKIIYPVAIMAASKSPEAAAYVAYIRSAAARPLFERWGFNVLE
jgi:molybdate transport system substrate-binding protein